MEIAHKPHLGATIPHWPDNWRRNLRASSYPPQGFAFQRVYTDDRSLDEACAVEDHDVMMVPHGYDSYYLNVMAGPNRLWVFRNGPAHEWMLKRTTT